MEKYIFWVTAIFQIGVFALMLYYLFIALFGFYKKKDTKTFEPQKKFAMLVAAHNEEVVMIYLLLQITVLIILLRLQEQQGQMYLKDLIKRREVRVSH